MPPSRASLETCPTSDTCTTGDTCPESRVKFQCCDKLLDTCLTLIDNSATDLFGEIILALLFHDLALSFTASEWWLESDISVVRQIACR